MILENKMVFLKRFHILLLGIVEGVVSVSLSLVFVLPLFFVLWLVNGVSRLLVAIYLSLKYNGEVVLTENGLDNLWGYRTPAGGNSRNVLFVATYAHKIDGERYREKFLSDVIGFRAPDGSKPYQKLKQIFVEESGYYCWKKDRNFDIHNHVILYPSERLFTESDLMDLLQELAQDMSDDHPQWQEIIIPNFTYTQSHKFIAENKVNGTGEQSLRILRFHHSYGT